MWKLPWSQILVGMDPRLRWSLGFWPHHCLLERAQPLSALLSFSFSAYRLGGPLSLNSYSCEIGGFCCIFRVLSH